MMNVGASGGVNLQDLASAAQSAQSPAQRLISQFDTVNKDGKLDQNELVNGGLDSVTAEKLINQLDKDGDKKLSEKEIEGILSKWDKSKAEEGGGAGGGASGGGPAKAAGGGGSEGSSLSNALDFFLEMLLNKADKNKDGKISKKEAKSVGISEAQFNKADANGDGSLSKQEFGTALVGAASGAESTSTATASPSATSTPMSISTV